MAFHWKKALPVFVALFFTVTAASCMRIHGPGIMPAVEDSVGGEWVVTQKKAVAAHEDSHGQKVNWWIVLQYMPSEGDQRITSTDIRALFDNHPIAFDFEEEGQMLRADVEAAFGPSIVHHFVLRPSEDPAVSFPSFDLVIP